MNNLSEIPVIMWYVNRHSCKSLMSRDHGNSDCYWLFISMLKIVKVNFRIAKIMF